MELRYAHGAERAVIPAVLRIELSLSVPQNMLRFGNGLRRVLVYGGHDRIELTVRGNIKARMASVVIGLRAVEGQNFDRSGIGRRVIVVETGRKLLRHHGVVQIIRRGCVGGEQPGVNAHIRHGLLIDPPDRVVHCQLDADLVVLVLDVVSDGTPNGGEVGPVQQPAVGILRIIQISFPAQLLG